MQHPLSLPRATPPGKRAGFALIITITLLAFLVLLLVSLASLTRVETQVAVNTRQIALARQNALMALNVALGRLQATAGSDQRVTATADIVAGAHDDRRRWTGVWDNTAATPAPEWLVSTATPAGAAGAAAVTTAMPATGTVQLVGSGSVDTNVAGNLVAVETQPITADAVPGLSGSQTIGNFAWWVGDEGVKAKVNLVDPGAASTATAEQQGYRLRVAQRSGIERVESAAGAPIGADYLANDAGISRLVGLQQLPMSNAAAQANLGLAIKNRFHDLTANSWSVLADVAQGGLKKDLTTWLAHPPAALATGAPTDAAPLFAQDGADTTGFGIPKWGIIRSYAGLEGGSARPPQVQTDRQQGFHPVITYFRIGFSGHSSALPLLADGVTPNPDGDTHLVAQVFPVVVLWNPYNTPIAASSYEVVFGLRYNNQRVQFTLGSGNTHKASLVFTGTPQLVSGSSDPSPNGETNRRMLRFQVNTPEIPAGQSLVFTLDSEGNYVRPGTAGAIPMSANDPPAMDNSVFFPNSAVTLTRAQREGIARVYIAVAPHFQVGLYPPQPAGADPSAADFAAQPPYMTVSLLKPSVFNSRTDIDLSPNPGLTPKGAYLWMRSQMPGYTNTNQYYLNSRWLAQLNPRAPYHLNITNGTSSGIGHPFTIAADNRQNGANANANPVGENFTGNRAYAGITIDSGSPGTLQIAELAPAATQPQSRFFSLAQLQHANFSLLGQTVGSAVGNSQVNFAIAAPTAPVNGKELTSRDTTFVTSEDISPNNQPKRFYDLSYLINRTLWDRYFFSTIPQSLTDAQLADAAFHLPNARHVFHRDNGTSPTASSLTATEAFNTAASRLLLNGGFNINSTSVQAWRALLASHNQVDSASSGAFTHPYARFSATQAGNPANTTDWSSGYRILSDAQIDALAEKIVAEVRARGPFTSLASFVNRRLVNDSTGLKGPLQAAIDATDTESDANRRINDRAPFNTATHRVHPQAYQGGTSPTLHQRQIFLADDAADATRPSASRAAFAPGFLTQADLLNSLGPVLSARSDTFLIRAYGDVQNPVTNEIEGKAWCEAVVQRVVEPVQRASAVATDSAYNEPATVTAPAVDFGRRFKVVSFRWLTAGDI